MLLVISSNTLMNDDINFMFFNSFCREIVPLAELQKRADRADQSVLIFLAGANFWEKHAKNCAFMSMAHSTYTITH